MQVMKGRLELKQLLDCFLDDLVHKEGDAGGLKAVRAGEIFGGEGGIFQAY